MIKLVYMLLVIKIGLYLLAGIMYASYKDDELKRSNLGTKGLSIEARIAAVLLWPVWLCANIFYKFIKYINK